MMRLVRINGRCQRCNQRWTAKNAMALAARHHRRTGHPVEVESLYRAGDAPKRAGRDSELPL